MTGNQNSQGDAGPERGFWHGLHHRGSSLIRATTKADGVVAETKLGDVWEG
jgi:hypothetical protein